MPLYGYTATDRKGKTVTGKQEAPNSDAVAGFLHDKGLVVVEVNELIGIDFQQILSAQVGGVPLADRVIFAKQLSTMLSAGLPLIQALEILVQQTENKSLRKKLDKVYKDVSSGISLSEAFRKDQTMFSPVQLNLLVAGEQSGNLNEIMQKVAEDLEKSKQLRGKIVGALIYPIVLFVVMAIVVAAMLVFMIPAVKDLFGDNELPWVTQVLVNLSAFVTSPFGVTLMVSVFAFVFGASRYYRSTKEGRRATDRWLLKVPVFGTLIGKIQLAEFCRLLSMLLQSGLPIVDVLNIIADALSNTAYSDVVRSAAIQVAKGNSLTIPLAKNEVFPLILLKMLATGEETGKLDQVAADMGRFYENEVNDITANLSKAMEPVIMVLVGFVVAFLAFAIYLPIYQLGTIVT